MISVGQDGKRKSRLKFHPYAAGLAAAYRVKRGLALVCGRIPGCVTGETRNPIVCGRSRGRVTGVIMKRNVFLSLILVCLLSACVATAQETHGAIVGRVSDPSGALIPGASVVVTNAAMGTKLSLKTGTDGFYQALFLQPGIYKLEAAAQGFKKLEREGVEVRLADRLEINLELEVGSSELSVTVTAEAPLMNTESASVGTLVDSRRVSMLPLSYGNPFLITGLASGVAFVGDPRLDRPFEPTHIVNYAMTGTRGDLSDITIDGGPTTARTGSSVIAAYVPPTDAVAEFKVQTATFDASFGQTQGGVTNMIVKSGTNTLHGTGFFSFYRPSMWANDFFNNKKGGARPPFTYNRWGGSVGGPIWLGKLYNGKNKTFFFYSYEGIHDRRPRYDGSAKRCPLRRCWEAISRRCWRWGRATRSTTPLRAWPWPAGGSRKLPSQATSCR